MIGIWITMLGLISSLNTTRAVPATETELDTQPTSHPPHALPSDQHEGRFGPIEESDMSILCQPCQKNDAEMPSISGDKVTTGGKGQAGHITSSTNKRARKPRMICPDHDTGKQRTFCIGCQIDGTGGGSLCIGGHGKRKYACKECHPDKHEANQKAQKAIYSRNRGQGTINCPDHNTDQRRSYCIECQKAGTGGGGLCKRGHGKRKADCKECHPEEHAANSLKRKERREEYKRNLKMIVHETSDKKPSWSDTNDGSSDDSSGDKSKCVCGNELDSIKDPICNECASDLAIMFK